MNLGIRSRVLLIAWGPAALIAIALAVYFVSSNLAALRASRRILGQTLSRQLAPAAQYGVLANNATLLRHLIDPALTQSAVSSIVIENRSGRILASDFHQRHPMSLVEQAGQFLANLISGSSGNAWTFTSPVVIRPLPVGPGFRLFNTRTPKFSNPDETLGSVQVTLSTEHLGEQESRILIKGLVLMLLGLLATFVLAERMSRSITHPVLRMLRSVSDLSQGQMSARLPESSYGELGRLEHGINQLAEQIGHSTRQLEAEVTQATQELRETLEEVESKNVALDLARKQAVAANRAKTAFLANINHEIRTPMNTILGYADFLTATPLDADQQEYLGWIQRSGQHLLGLIDEVLHFSRIEAGHLDLSQAPCDVHILLEEVIAALAPQALQKGLDFLPDLYEGPPLQVLADAGRLRQILNNLIGNALKFTEHGLIRIRARQEVDAERITFHLAVEDEGIGLSPEDRGRIFEPFAQADNSTSRRFGGVGLGLAICRRIVEAMKGTIRVDSQPGAGTRFVVHLSFTRVPETAPAPTPDFSCRLHLQGPPVYRECFGRRFAAWGFEVTAPLAGGTVPEPSEGRSGRPILEVEILGLAELAGEKALEAAAPESPRRLILAATADRRELRRIGLARNAICLPIHTPVRDLKKALGELLEAYPVEPSPNGRTPEVDFWDLFRQELPRQVLTLREAWTVRPDPMRIREAFHQLEGTARFCKLPSLQAAVSQLRTHGQAHPDDHGLASTAWQNLGQTVTAILAYSATRPPAPVQLPAANPPDLLGEIRVLVAEDNPINRTLIGRMLEQQGARVWLCSNGVGLVSLIETVEPDVVLLDIHMPEMDGIETARRITESHPGLPLVAISADILPETRIRALNSGIQEYLVKPIRATALAETIQQVLDRSSRHPRPPQRPAPSPAHPLG
jgi:signal transduction histidine kinase/ActR/RegA family two-component response regulator